MGKGKGETRGGGVMANVSKGGGRSIWGQLWQSIGSRPWRERSIGGDGKGAKKPAHLHQGSSGSRIAKEKRLRKGGIPRRKPFGNRRVISFHGGKLTGGKRENKEGVKKKDVLFLGDNRNRMDQVWI